MLDTTKVQGRRNLRFAGLDDLLADAQTCAKADAAGGRGLRRLGNWSLGQALNHIAAWIEFPYTGYPPELVIPDEMRTRAIAAKGRIMREAMHPGERLPGLESAGGTLAIEDAPTEVGLARLEAAAALLRSGDPPIPDPAFGRLTRHELLEMTLRHAELHLSFFIPSGHERQP